MKRPLWVIGLSYGTALFIAVQTPTAVTICLLVLSLVGLGLVGLFPVLRRRLSVWAVLLTAAAAFSVSIGAEAVLVRPLLRWNGASCSMQAQVIDWRSDAYVVQTLSGDLPAGTRVLVYPQPSQPVPDLYDQVAGTFVVSSQEESASFYRADRILLRGFCAAYGDEALTISPPARSSWKTVLAGWREQLAGSIRRLLPGEEGRLIQAICLGDKSALSADTLSGFRRSGVSHLLAVSGLHVAIVAQALLALLKKLRLPVRLAAALSIPGVIGFVLLTGAASSAVRAGVMMTVLLIGQVISRRADSRNSLGLALLLLTVPEPYAVLDIGLQLSFAATAGLILLAPFLQKQTDRLLTRKQKPGARPAKWLAVPLHAICVTAAATLPLLPLLAVSFGELSVIAPLTNLLTVYPTSLLLSIGCLALAVSPIPFLGWLLRGLLFGGGLLAKYLLAVTGTIGSWPFVTVPVREPYQLVWLTGTLLFLLLGYRLLKGKGLRRGLALSVLTLAIGLGLHTALMRGVATITTVSADDSTVVLVEKDGHAGLIVSGDSPSLLSAAQYALSDRGIRRLDFLLLPAQEAEALGGLPDFFSRIPTESLLYPASGENRATLDAVSVPHRQVYQPLDRLLFWETGELTCTAEGFCRLSLGDTRILLCPADGDVSALSPDWRRTHLAVFSGPAAPGAASLTAVGGVVSARDHTVSATLPWGRFPIYQTANGDVSARTRGEGDLTFCSP